MAWLGLIASGWLQSLNGSPFLFGSYSQSLKLSLGLDQRSINTLAFFCSLGTSCGIGPALLYDRIPPAAIVVLGISHTTIGYFLTWLAIKNPSLFELWHLCLFQLLIGMAQTYVQTAALVRGLKIFQGSRGFVLGYLKGLVGLSASILVQFYLLLCRGREECMPLMLSWLLPLLCLAPILILCRGIPPPHPPKRWNFHFLAASVTFLAMFLLATLIIESFVTLDQLQIGLLNLGLFAILLSPIYVLIRENAQKSSPLLGLEETSQSRTVKDDGGFSTLQAIKSLDLWLLCGGILFATASSGVVVSNLSQFGHALGYSSQSVSIAISLLSIFSCLGRVSSGILSEHCVNVHGTSRPLFLALAAAIQALGLILGSFAVPGSLFWLAILTGVAEGSIWCVAIATASDLFGLKSFSSILNILIATPPIGELLLSVLLVGWIYDSQGSGLVCVGAHCFGLSFLAVAGICCIGGAVFGVLALRSRKMYASISSSSPVH